MPNVITTAERNKSEIYLTFANVRCIIAPQIPKIAIIVTPVRGMRVVHQPASARS